MVDFPLFKKISIDGLAELVCGKIPNCNINEIKSYFASNVDRSLQGRFRDLTSPTGDPVFDAQIVDYYTPPDEDEMRDFAADRRGQKKDGIINTFESFYFIKKTKYGHSLEENSVGEAVFFSLQKAFFGNSPLDEANSSIEPLIVQMAWFTDGDTAKTAKALINGAWTELKMKLRAVLVDTPESYVGTRNKEGRVVLKNPKLELFENYTWLLWKAKFGLGMNGDEIKGYAEDIVRAGNNAKKVEQIWAKIKESQIPSDILLIQMIENRIVYNGLVAGAIPKGLVEWANKKGIPFTIVPSYNRASTDPAVCNSIEYADVYDRNLAEIYIGLPTSSENYLADFIENELPLIMEGPAQEYYDNFHDNKKPADIAHKDWAKDVVAAFDPSGQEFLSGLKGAMKDNPELAEIYNALAPETILKPSEIFTREYCKMLAGLWRDGFSARYPGFKNNVLMMLVFLGVAYTYAKYRSPNTGLALELEKAVLLGKGEPGQKRRGLTDDIIYSLGRPDPENSEMFKVFGAQLSRGVDLRPQDCCELLLEQGKDVYWHCRPVN